MYYTLQGLQRDRCTVISASEGLRQEDHQPALYREFKASLERKKDKRATSGVQEHAGIWGQHPGAREQQIPISPVPSCAALTLPRGGRVSSVTTAAAQMLARQELGMQALGRLWGALMSRTRARQSLQLLLTFGLFLGCNSPSRPVGSEALIPWPPGM